MQASEFRHQLGLEIARLAAVPTDALSTPIPHLEGWTVHSVLGHTGWVTRYVVNCVNASPDRAPSRASVGEPPVGADVVDWFVDGANAALEVLSNVDLDTMSPTWTGPQPTSWWLRRLTHELAMHRWDCEAAITAPTPIDAQLAVDGMDEVLEVFAPNRLQFDVLDSPDRTIHLHATDLEGGEWMIFLGQSALTWERGHAKGDAVARGSASDLLALMWGRLTPEDVEVFGDETLLDQWQKAARF